MIASFVLRLTLRAFPAAFREHWAREMAATYVEGCRAALERGSRWAAVRHAIAELLDLVVAAIRRRLGKSPAIQAGHPPGGHKPRRGAPMKNLLSSLGRDARAGTRSLLASRSHTAIAVLTLSLGIGINAAVFSILDAIVFTPVPYAQADRLASLWSFNPQGKFIFKGGFTPALILEWRKQQDLFDRVEGYETRSAVFENAAGAEMVPAAIVTPGLLWTLGVAPVRGRLFTDGDGLDGTDRLVVISERFWREQLRSDPEVVGRLIKLDDASHEIVGVMPASFRYPDEQHGLWLPSDPGRPGPASRPARSSFVLLARAVAGLTRPQVEAEVARRGPSVHQAAGAQTGSSAKVVQMGVTFDARTERSLLVLGGAVIFLLLIVCANVGNLTLSRSLTRARDLAVRTALGASRADVIRETLIEHALVGVAGAALGVLIARLAVTLTTGMLPEAMTLSSLNAVDLDARALLFLLGSTLATTTLVALPPAWLASRSSVTTLLRGESRSATGSIAGRRLRSLLVVAEVALSIVLLIGAALMTRSLIKLQSIDTGMDASGLIAMRLGLPAVGYQDTSVRDSFSRDVTADIRRQPGVLAASVGSLPPDSEHIAMGPLEFGDRPDQPAKPAMLRVYPAGPDYFAAAGIRLVDGRAFAPDDPPGYAIVSQGFASKHWPGQRAAGRRFRVGQSDWRTIAGVAAEVRRMSEDDDSTQYEVYYPAGQMTGLMTAVKPKSVMADYRTVLVRASDPAAVLPRLAASVHRVDPRVVVWKTTIVEHQLSNAIARPRLVFLLMSVFAGFGLLLAAAGLYGVLSCLVAQRLREIGIRLALGASRNHVGRLVIGRGLGLAAIGLVIGIAAAIGLMRVMRSLLYEVEPSDPASIALVSAVLIAVSVAACWWPARRAMRVDPVALLRDE